MEDDLCERLHVPFAFPALKGQNVLVLGLGGGCDIITAYAISTLLDPSANKIVYGNTKVGNIGPVESITPHIARVASPPPEPGHKPQGCGKAATDHSVPRNAHGSPWIVQLDDEIGEPAGGSTPENAEHSLVGEIRSLGFDRILGVDAGGDSIVAQRRAHLGRDQRMLRILFQTEVPVLHVVVAPGCDGQSSAAVLRTAMEQRLASGQYRGYFALTPLLPVLRQQSSGLRESRTPCLILSAADGKLAQTKSGGVIVPRGCKPVVPAWWLANAFVFGPKLT